MKDVMGKDLFIGTKILFAISGKYGKLYKGTVTKFTAKTMMVTTSDGFVHRLVAPGRYSKDKVLKPFDNVLKYDW